MYQDKRQGKASTSIIKVGFQADVRVEWLSLTCMQSMEVANARLVFDKMSQ